MGRRDWNSFAEGFNKSFGDSFSQGMRMAMYKKMMDEDRAQNQIKYDAMLGTRGFRRMDDDEAKEYLASLNQKGLPVAGGGYVGLPPGAKLDNGTIYDQGGNIIGSYLPGEEPKPIKNYLDKYPDGKVRIGTNFYSYDEDLAKKMKNAQPDLDIDTIKQEMEEQGLGGTVVPATFSKKGTSYRYNPTQEEKMGVGGMPGAQPGPSRPVTQPGATSQIGLDQYRKAIQNAIAGGATRDEIINGIRKGGYNEKDFEDLLYAYSPSVSPMRRSILGSLMKNVGIPAGASLNYINAFSSKIDEYKKRKK